MSDKPIKYEGCWKCAHKRKVPGSCHISCAHPKARQIDFGFKAAPHGVKMGWFMWPFNFDPTWMEGECNQYESAEVGGDLPKAAID